MAGPNRLNPWRVAIGSEAATTGQASVAVAHGLGETPDFVIVQGSDAIAEGAAAGSIGWSATATTLTITRADTAAEETVTYIAAKL